MSTTTPTKQILRILKGEHPDHWGEGWDFLPLNLLGEVLLAVNYAKISFPIEQHRGPGFHQAIRTHLGHLNYIGVFVEVKEAMMWLAENELRDEVAQAFLDRHAKLYKPKRKKKAEADAE